MSTGGMVTHNKFWPLVLGILSLVSIKTAEARAETKNRMGIDASTIDQAVAPCDDFYRFACGAWIDKAEIPPERSGWSRGFSSIDEHNQQALRTLLEELAAAKKPADSLEERQLGDYYRACMDETAAETEALPLLRRRLAAIQAIKTPRDLAVQVARAHLEGSGSFFSFGNTQDARDSSQMIGEVDQGGLSLPGREYYLEKDGKFPQIRQSYTAHVQAMLELLGDTPATAAAATQQVMDLETKLAAASLDRVARRDPHNLYHRLERPGLEALTPAFDWHAYFSVLGFPSLQTINVATPGFFKALNDLLRQEPLPTMRAYLRWHMLERATSTLGKAFVEEEFRFSSKNLTGQKALAPRWKRCLAATQHALEHPLAKGYIARNFSPKAKEQTQSMIKSIEDALGHTLSDVTWMDEPTRREALAKLKTMMNQIGYPERWRDYHDLAVGKTFLGNVLAASVFNSRYYLRKIGKPVDRDEWWMSPSTVNAYYSAENNQIVFPAGILQAPFYSENAPLPANYGAIGMVMGHELTHGFDDQGRKFDARGNLRDWWSPKVGEEFDQRAACLVEQFSSYEPLPNQHINGKLTLGENIADHGGIKIAWRGWHADQTEAAPDSAGFTPEQQFFLGFAQSWCTKNREEFQRTLLTTDPHSPPRFRVNGTLRNFDEFAKAFRCAEGTPMAPKQRCHVW